MRNHGKSTAAWALTIACWGATGSALLTSAGCEKMEGAERQADRTAVGHLDKSLTDRAKGGDAGNAAAYDDLKKAAATAGTSSASKVRAASELAQEEFDRAVAQFPEIDRRTLQIEQTLWNLHQAGLQIQQTQKLAASFTTLEPKEALAAVEEQRAKIKAGSDKSKADADAAQAELAKRQKEIDALKEDRKTADASAEALAQKAAGAKGDESIKLFEQVTAARIRAGGLAAQIEAKTGALLPYERDLAVAQSTQKHWDNASKETPGALQQLDEQKQQVDAGWQKIQAQAQASADLAKGILATTIKPAKTDAGENDGECLRTLVEKNEKQCGEVARLLNDSIKHFGDAAAAARKLSTDLQAKIRDTKNTAAPELIAFKGMMALYDENQYLLQQGTAQNALGDLHTTQAVEYKHRKETLDGLAKALSDSKLQLPTELPVADLAKATEDAVGDYKNAEKTLDPVAEATKSSEDLLIVKGAARIGLLHAHLGRYSLARDEDSKSAFKTDQLKAKESNLDLPAQLKQTIE